MNKKDLEKLLKYHDNLYYNQDSPELSDIEYDALKNNYVAEHGEYNYVPGEASKDSKRYKHTSNISSLDKIQITDEDRLKEEIERLWPVVFQPKMDGLTLVSYPNYETAEGTNLGEDVTRGNGLEGEIVTKNTKTVAGIGSRMTAPVRSEVVMHISDFNRINEQRIKDGLEPHKNPRNAAAGMLRQKDASKVNSLTAYAYNIIISTAEQGDEVNNNSQQIDSLKVSGWNTVDSYSPETKEDALDYILNFDRSNFDYEIDGIVMKHDGSNKFGYTSHHPKAAVAIKFAQEGVWATVKRVVNQVGRTGIEK